VDTNGVSQTRYTYEPFGITTQTGISSSNSFAFAGRESDTAGLYYYRARYYDPATGRFISEDPLAFDGGDVNLYRYARNNPISFTDPSGEAVPLLLLLPAVGGTVGGIADVLTAGLCENKWKAFGRGFVSGAVGTLAGMGVGALTGNPWLAGAATGETSSILDQGLAGEPIDAIKVAESTAVGAVGGKLVSELFPTRGRLPSLTRPRTLQNLGPNSQRLVSQEFGNDALGGTGQYTCHKYTHGHPPCCCDAPRKGRVH